MEMDFSRAATTALCGALSLASLPALSGCEQKPPTPVTMSLLQSPAALPLEGERVQFAGQIQFLNSTTHSVWYEPPPIIMPCGDSIIIIPEAGYYIDKTSYVHRVTWSENQQTREWTFDSSAQYSDGTYQIAGRYYRLGNDGSFNLENLEVVSSGR